MPGDYLPTASLDALRLRARLLAAIRHFFDSRGYFEVETPLLSHDVVVDAFLEPFVTCGASGCDSGPRDRLKPVTTNVTCGASQDVGEAGVPGRTPGTLYLQTSPEFGMKRLLAAGATAIYQITRALRSGDQGRLHNPEFTIVEWYRVGDTHFDQMAFEGELVSAVFDEAAAWSKDWTSQNAAGCVAARHRPFERITYDEAFDRYAGRRVIESSCAQLAELSARHGLNLPAGLNRDDPDVWRNLLLAEVVAPALGRERPTFLYDYPASQAALARIRPGNPPVAERFELFIKGIEVSNGYHELTDAAELRRRIDAQSRLRVANGSRPLPHDSRLLDAMDAGLPQCAGVALGFDRLMMLAIGGESLAEVMAFPFDRA